jgi:monoamine oxidase
MPSHNVDVVIVGAGAAGLAAARSLHEEGLDIVIHEARDRIGGRVCTRRDTNTLVPIELGAEFIHGRAADLNALLDDAALARIDITGRRWYVSRRRLRPFDDFWEVLDRVMRRLHATPTRDRSFHEFLEARPGRRRLAFERALARQFVEGFHGADPRLISAAALAESGSPGDDPHERRLGRVADGYDRALEWLAAPVARRIRLSSPVTAVQWAPGAVSVEIGRHGTGTTSSVDARAVIVTVPIGVLKARPGSIGAIRFVPAIEGKMRPLDQIGVGSALRVVLRLNEPFWTKDRFAEQRHADELDTLSFLHGRDRDFPTWWTTYPVATPVIVGWCGGLRARQLSMLPSSGIVERAIDALARQVGVERRRLTARVDAAWTHNWEHDPFARGAYSYQMVGGANAPSALARSLHGTLFFAGEATETSGATGTVHGAIATGRRAAKQVLRALGATKRAKTA